MSTLTQRGTKKSCLREKNITCLPGRGGNDIPIKETQEKNVG